MVAYMAAGSWQCGPKRGLILDRELPADFESVWVSVGEETWLDGGDEGGLNEVSGTRG